MLLTGGHMIGQGELDEACDQVLEVLRRIDGEPEPPDFADGERVDLLGEATTSLRSELGCAA